MLVMSSPSGAGKSTLSRRLLADDKDVRMSVSGTTRPERPGEVDGTDYFFLAHDKFSQMVSDEEFLGKSEADEAAVDEKSGKVTKNRISAH